MTTHNVAVGMRTVDSETDVSGAPEGRRLRRWWDGPWGRQLLVELATIVTVYMAYKAIRSLARHQQVEAFANAHRVVRWERAVGLFNEIDLQHLAMHSRLVIETLNRYYATVHFPLTVTVIVWAYVWRRDTVYRQLRFFLLTTTLVALVVHVSFPLAPPRMLPQLGFVDTLSRYGPHIYPKNPQQSIANQFASMPSLHFAWALLIAWCVAPSLRRRSVSAAVWAHPALTLLAITATANHYWVDSIAGGLLVVAAWAAWRTMVTRGTSVMVPALAEPTALT